MLTIREKLPVKKMALYGSTAVLVGFAGTYTMLREAFPYNSRDNVADVNWERKQAANGSMIKPATKASDEKSTDTPEDALKESGMVANEAPGVTQQAPNTHAPTIPASNSGPITATPSVAPTPPTTIEPAVTTPAPQPEPQPVPEPIVDPAPTVDEPGVPVAPLIESTTESIINVQVKP